MSGVEKIEDILPESLRDHDPLTLEDKAVGDRQVLAEGPIWASCWAEFVKSRWEAVVNDVDECLIIRVNTGCSKNLVVTEVNTVNRRSRLDASMNAKGR